MNGIVWEKKWTAIRWQIKWWVQKVDIFLKNLSCGSLSLCHGMSYSCRHRRCPRIRRGPANMLNKQLQAANNRRPSTVEYTEERNCQEQNIPTSKYPKTHLDLSWWEDSQTDVSKWTNSTDIWYGETKSQESNNVEVKQHQLKCRDCSSGELLW